MSDVSTDRLSEYLDDELSPGERAALEGHLAGCAECSATLADLRRVVARARALESTGPATDLWPGIAAGIGAAPTLRAEGPGRGRAHGRFTFSLPQLLAAGIALMVLSGGSVWFPTRFRTGGDHGRRQRLSSGARGKRLGTPASWQRRAAPGYDAAVAEPWSGIGGRPGAARSATVRVLERTPGSSTRR